MVAPMPAISIQTNFGQTQPQIQVGSPSPQPSKPERAPYGNLTNSRVKQDKSLVLGHMFVYAKLQKENSPKAFGSRKVALDHLLRTHHHNSVSLSPSKRRLRTKRPADTPAASSSQQLQSQSPLPPKQDALDLFMSQKGVTVLAAKK